MPYSGRNGPPAKSAAQKKAEGRGITHPLAKSTVPVQAKGVARCPDHLSKDEKALWEEVVGSMPNGTYSQADELLLEKVVTNMVMVRRCQRQIIRDGITIRGVNGRVKHPAWMVLNQAQAAMQTAAEALGLSPLSRNRLVAPVDKEPGSSIIAEDLFGNDPLTTLPEAGGKPPYAN